MCRYKAILAPRTQRDLYIPENIADDWNDARFEELEKQFLHLPEELHDQDNTTIEEPDDLSELYKMYSAVVFPYDCAQTRATSSASYSTLAPICNTKYPGSLAASDPQFTTPTLQEDIPQTEWQTESSASTPSLSYSAASSPANAYEYSATDEGRLFTPDSDVSDTCDAASIASDKEQGAEDPRTARGRKSSLAPRRRKRAVEDDDEYIDESSGSLRAPLRKRTHIRRLDDDDERSQTPRKRSGNTMTRSRDWRCPHCSLATFTKSDLKRHVLKHEAKKYFCKHSKCNKRLFARIDALKRHVRLSHRDFGKTLLGNLTEIS